MKNPFKKLIEAFRHWANGTESGFKTPPELAAYAHEIRPQPRESLTAFEKDLFDRFEYLHGDDNYSAICVSIREKTNEGYLYIHPVTLLPVKGEIVISLWTKHPDFAFHINDERRMKRQPVMLFDLHGPTLQQQMPAGWRPGKIPFPNKFLETPHISVPHSGELAPCKKLQGIGLTSDPVPARYEPSIVAAFELPAEFVKVAVCTNKAGEERDIPQDVIRGVFINNNYEASHRSTKPRNFPRII